MDCSAQTFVCHLKANVCHLSSSGQNIHSLLWVHFPTKKVYGFGIWHEIRELQIARLELTGRTRGILLTSVLLSLCLIILPRSCVFHSDAMIKSTLTKSNLGRKRFICLTLPSHSPLSRELRAGTPTAVWSRSRGGMPLVGSFSGLLSPRLYLAIFLT